VLVIVIAVGVGAFVVSIGIDDPQTVETAEGTEVAAAGPETTAVTDQTADSAVAGAAATVAPGATSTTSAGGASSTSTSTSTAADAPTRPPGEVTVLVLNGSGTRGIAAEGSTVLEDAGYTMMAPKNADGFGPSQVLYAETYEAEAVAVAEAFGIAPASVVAPLDPASPPTSEDFEGANVIVIIGEDGVIDPT
jgi:hypothetical protein